MALSTQTLFHFTSSIDHLISILVDDFRPHYALEDFRFLASQPPTGGALNMAYPMVCFCDIPLSQAHRHMQTYGHYAIGLSKDWGLRNGITPVLYTHAKSLVASTLIRLYGLVRGPVDMKERLKSDELMHVGTLLSLLKQYEGELVRPGGAVQSVRFYDEREWRWLPFDPREVFPLRRAEYLDFAKLREANAEAHEKARLSFEAADVRYLIVASEAERLPMIHALDRLRGRYSDEIVRLLSSRILTAEQVRGDF